MSRLRALALSAALAATACSAPRLDPARVKDACAWLTKAEAESVLERPAWAAHRFVEAGYSICSYRAVLAPQHAVTLRWHMGDANARDPVAEFVSAQREALAVSRVGDAAFWIPDRRPTPESAGTLWVRKGGQVFKVTAGAVPGHPPWRMAKELARDVLRRF